MCFCWYQKEGLYFSKKQWENFHERQPLVLDAIQSFCDGQIVDACVQITEDICAILCFPYPNLRLEYNKDKKEFSPLRDVTLTFDQVHYICNNWVEINSRLGELTLSANKRKINGGQAQARLLE